MMVAGQVMGMLMGGAGAAAGAAGAGAAGAAAGGSMFATLLQGGMTLFSVVSSLNAADEQASALNAQADDALLQVDQEALAGIERRRSLKAEAFDSVGKQAVAFAASGVDLTFGSPVVARNEAFGALDRAETADIGTEQTRVSRLQQRSASYKKRAKGAKRAGLFKAFGTAAKFGMSVANRG